MKATVSLRRNRDGTATFKYGGYVESFEINGKERDEVYEHIRWIAITAGIPLSKEVLLDMYKETREF
jgi:hypothetical protein